MRGDVVVLVVGAGPTGLALSCGLLSAGIPVHLVDAASGPARTSRALGLQARGVEVLDRLGALADLPDRALHMTGTVLRGDDGMEKLTLRVPDGRHPSVRPPLVISQADIEAQLRARLAELGGTVEWGWELTTLTQDAAGVQGSSADGRTRRADWMVGCDGASSAVRKCAGIALEGHTAAQRFLLADVEIDLPVAPGLATMWAGHDGALAAVPLPGPRRWRLMAPIPPEEPDDLSEEAVVESLQRLVQRRVGIDGIDKSTISWTSTFRVHERLASAYRAGRILLAGDAAHINGPIGGQGLNTGIGDAENLAWKLALVAGGHAEPVLLDSYEAERRPVAQSVVSTVGGVDTLMLSRNPLLAFARDRVLLPLAGRPEIQRRIWDKASQLGISYRRGPLAGRGGWHVVPGRPGDRVDDLRCRHPDARATRLHAELRDGRWAVVTTDTGLARAATDLVRYRLGDRVTPLLVRDRRSDRIMLVRPDAHLAWQGRDLTSLTRWVDDAVRRGVTRRRPGPLWGRRRGAPTASEP